MNQYQELQDGIPLEVQGYNVVAYTPPPLAPGSVDAPAILVVGSNIPNDPANADYIAMIADVDAGTGQILPYVPPSQEEEESLAADQAIADAVARAPLYQTLTVLIGKLDANQLSVKEATLVHSFITPWSSAGVDYVVEQLCNHDGKTYRCIQAHTSQPGWEPPNVPALFTVYVDPDGPPQPWVQPQGAHDAYTTGNQVTHNGNTWTSTVDANVWEPGVYGWNQM